MYFWYISKKYIKNFFLVLISLGVLFVVVDYSFNFNKLPSSSNLQVLYIFYVFLYSIFVIYPLAFVFSFLITLNSMIKFNELVSFYSLGFKPSKIFKPILIFSLVVYFFMIMLQFTKISYANEYAKAIKNGNRLTTQNLFLKFNNAIIYISKLDPIKKIAFDMKVFYIKNDTLKKIIIAKEAKFSNNRWIANATVEILDKNRWQKESKEIIFLENFKPKILSNLKSLNNISFYDAYLAIKYFKDLDLNKILSIVFFKVFTPLSMIVMISIIFVLSPIHIRISNISFFMIKSVTFSILVWAAELILYKFTKQGILPYYVLTIPFIMLILLYMVIRRNND